MTLFPSIVTVGAALNISEEDILTVTTSPVFARVVVLLLDAIDVVIVGAVLSIVTVDPSVVALRDEAPIFSLAS